jgi:parvulin-like peptidyl-prolyl isomerase
VQTQFGATFGESTEAQRQRVLDDMIAEELMVQRGLDADLASYDPEVRQALVNGVELQIFADVLARQPSDEQLIAYYEKNKAKYVRDGVMQLRDLVSDDAPAAGKAVVALRHGKALDAVMSEFGLRDSRKLLDSGHVDLGDVFDFSAKARLDAPVFAVASTLSAGQTSDPVLCSDGAHIVVMMKREPPRQRPFAEVRNEVWTDLKKDAQDQVRNGNLKYLTGKADIRIAEKKW